MENHTKTFFAEHPTMLLTMCYFIITAIGVLYSYFFYDQFGINIIKFADLSDFLLASILEPLSLMVFIGMVLFSVVGAMVEVYLKKKFQGFGEFVDNKLNPTGLSRFLRRLFSGNRFDRYLDKQLNSNLGQITINAGAVLLATTLLLQALALKNAKVIKSGQIDEFQVRLADTGDQAAEQTLALLGSSSRFNYFYNNKTQKTIVVPVENVSYMVKTVDAKEEKQVAEKASKEIRLEEKIPQELLDKDKFEPDSAEQEKPEQEKSDDLDDEDINAI